MALRVALCRGGTNVARSAVNRLLPPPHYHHQPPYCCRRIHATTYADENTSPRQKISDQRKRLDVAIVGAPNAG
eukprot:scaffold24956_cov67-Skeletonema_dohrnii-CCMP3373.AAC.1